ncbi:COG2426 family protein [Litchfieldia alkalitelluris]|uniref:COG2426 family protein n=1 Tax=Litchfieldia alkalitelluris TaxID=304268 RepID=UPI00099778C8|nr:small multi-drug export protein [Litchfieldia alkalitelluris]
MKEAIRDYLVRNLDFLPPELVTIVVSAIPILELRGGLPLAYIYYDLSLLTSALLSIVGNILPIVPLLLLFKPISSILMRFSWYKKMYDWLYHRTMSKSGKVEKYGAIGLILFTALPLPTTGAWSACVAASIFAIPFRYAFIAISTGVVIAAVIVSLGILSISIF